MVNHLKAELIQEFGTKALPLFENKKLKTIIDSSFKFEDIIKGNYLK